MKKLIVIAVLLSCTVHAQNVVLGVQSGLPIHIDTVAWFTNARMSNVDRNGVDIDVWHGNNVWTICNYKKVDSGYQCIFHSDNELYIFQDRKLIKRYYSNCKIHYK